MVANLEQFLKCRLSRSIACPFRKLARDNEEFVQPDSGLGMYSHSDMEIFTYNPKSDLCHQGSIGGREQVRAGDALMNSDEQHVDHSAGSNAEVLLFDLA